MRSYKLAFIPLKQFIFLVQVNNSICATDFFLILDNRYIVIFTIEKFSLKSVYFMKSIENEAIVIKKGNLKGIFHLLNDISPLI